MNWDDGGAESATILCDRYWPDVYGGLERKMWNLSRALGRYGWRVRVLTENRTGAAAQETIEPNLVVRRIEPARYGPFWRCISIVRFIWWYRMVRSHVPEGTIWASDPRVAAAVILAGRRRDLVYQPIGCQVAMNRLSRVYPHVDSMRTTAVLRGFDRFAYRYAPRIIFESENAREQFRACYGQRSNVSVVHNGVESPPAGCQGRLLAKRALGLDDRHWVVGFMGRLDPCKDVGFLLRAVSLMEDGHNIRVLVAGDGPDRARLKRMATQFGVDDRVVWAGRCDDPIEAYAAMDVMVLPSVYEVFGNVLQEAMAAGVPVVGRCRDSDPSRPVLVANEELIQQGQTGFIVDPHDPKDMATKLSVLRLFPGARDAMGRRCQAWAVARPWEAVVREYLDVLGRVGNEAIAKAA